MYLRRVCMVAIGNGNGSKVGVSGTSAMVH